MSLLVRYKKPGGFKQLLYLIETCSDKKKAQLLTLIEAESEQWAATIKEKMLTVERIFSWPPEHLCEITTQLPDEVLAITLKSVSDDVFERATSVMSQGQIRRMRDYIEGISPAQGQVDAAHIKVIQKVREMADNGFMKLEEVDPEMGLENLKVA